MKTTDILIVGAGAAGSTLGFLLKQAGRDVLSLEMLDAKKKNKLCAGILECRAEKAFSAIFEKTVDEAGLSTMPIREIITRCGEYELHRTMPGKNEQSSAAAIPPLTAKEGIGIQIRNYLKKGGKLAAKTAIKHAIGYEPGSFTFRALTRKNLDDYILSRYLEAGGKLLDRTTVCAIDTENHIATCMNLATRETFDVQYQTLVGADGASSTLRHLLTGRRQNTSFVLEAAVPLITEESIIYYTPEDHGYFWYFPRGADATAGCLYHKLGDKDGAICRERFFACCADMGLDMKGQLRGAMVPKGNDVLLRPGKDAFLIGDAAGLIDNFTGGGIHYALLSAKALADALIEDGGESFETLMKPHVSAVKKNFSNAGLYAMAGRTFISQLGQKRTKE